MTIATDFATYGMATANLTLTTSAQSIADMAGEDIPADCRQVVVLPNSTGCYLQIASSTTRAIEMPVLAHTFVGNKDSLDALEFTASGGATALTCILGGLSMSVGVS